MKLMMFDFVFLGVAIFDKMSRGDKIPRNPTPPTFFSDRESP